MLGSLLVETPDGRRFRLGSGFSDEERRRPPPVGAIVTYKHYGTTRKASRGSPASCACAPVTDATLVGCGENRLPAGEGRRPLIGAARRRARAGRGRYWRVKVSVP